MIIVIGLIVSIIVFYTLLIHIVLDIRKQERNATHDSNAVHIDMTKLNAYSQRNYIGRNMLDTASLDKCKTEEEKLIEFNRQMNIINK